MNPNVKKGLFYVLGLLVSVCLLGLLFVGNVSGPMRFYETQDKEMLQQFLDKTDYQKAKLLNRFSYERVHYFVLAEDENGVESIVWFNTDFELQGTASVVLLGKLVEVSEKYKVDDTMVSFGVYEDALVFVVKPSATQEIWLNQNMEIVFERGRS